MQSEIGIKTASGEWEPGARLVEPTTYGETWQEICPRGECKPGIGTPGNSAVYEQLAIDPGSGFRNNLQAGRVMIYQGTGPSVSFDTTDQTVHGAPTCSIRVRNG